MAIRYLSGINVDSNTLFVDSTNNRVGIGTNSPNSKLEVVGAGIFRDSPTTNDWGLSLQNTNTGGWGVSQFFNLYGYASSPVSDFSALQIRVDYPGYGRISFVVKEQAQSSAAESLILRGNGQVYMNAGNVGIGTTAPSYRLDVVATSNSTYPFIVRNAGNAEIGGIYSTSGGAGQIYLFNASSVATAKISTIDASYFNGGNLLVGTTTDAGYKLRVNGSSYFDAPILSYTGNGYITAITSDGVGSNNGFGYSFLITGANHEIGRVTGIYETSGGGGSGGLGFWTRGSGTLSAKMTLNSGGTLTLSNYGSGYKTGTATYGLAVDSSGNIIEVTSAIDGSGTANYVTKWQDSNTLTNSVIYDNGTNVGIGTTSPDVKFQVQGGAVKATTSNYASPSTGGAISMFQDSNDYGTIWAVKNYNGAWANVAISPLGGNVLIGTTTDGGYKLDVNGTARVSDTLFINTTDNRGKLNIIGYDNGGINIIDRRTSSSNVLFYSSVTFRDYYDSVVGASIDFYHNQYFGSGVNRLGFSFEGSERLTILRGGNVGIGTTSPLNLLHVSQASANTVFRLGNNASYDQFIYFNGNNDWSLGMDYSNSNAFVLSNASSIGTNDRVVVTTGGNVGIGTSAPGARFHVSAGYGLLSNAYSWAVYNTSSNGFAAQFGAADDVAFANTGNNAIISAAGSNSILFGTNSAERMRITSAGNVGINSGASSVYVLDVFSKDTAYNTRLYQPSSATDTYVSLILSGAMTSAIGYMGTGGSTAGNVAFRDNVVVGSQSNHPLVFNTNDGERGRFTAGGNLLIGTTTDAGYKLQVEGSVRSVGAMEPSNTTWINAAFTTKVGGSAYGGGLALIDGTAGWATYTTGSGQFLNFSSGATSGGVTMRMRLQNNGVVRMSAYGSGGVTGTAAYSLSVDANGDIIESASPLNATSLYDLLPAGRVAYNWVGQVVDDTWTTVFTKNDSILTTGTWMVKMYVNDFGVGGGHYQYVYSGIMTWDQGTVNQTGEAAFSEVYLHRMGHAANASILYLRTAESGAAGGNIGYFQIKGNYSNTSNQTIQFQFVKIF